MTKRKPRKPDPGGHCPCGVAWVNHNPVIRQENDLDVRRLCNGDEVYTTPSRVTPRPNCPECRSPMARVVPGKFGCVNYSGGCLNTRRLYHSDGTYAGGS